MCTILFFRLRCCINTCVKSSINWLNMKFCQQVMPMAPGILYILTFLFKFAKRQQFFSCTEFSNLIRLINGTQKSGLEMLTKRNKKIVSAKRKNNYLVFNKRNVNEIEGTL